MLRRAKPLKLFLHHGLKAVRCRGGLVTGEVWEAVHSFIGPEVPGVGQKNKARKADILLRMNRLLAIYLAMLVAAHALVGGAGGAAVLCFGGGHHHTPAEESHCQSTCSHDPSWPFSLPADDHDDDCGCTDIEITASELIATLRADHGASHTWDAVLEADWKLVRADAGLNQPGPPRPPPLLDPGGYQRLAIVASVRMTI